LHGNRRSWRAFHYPRLRARGHTRGQHTALDRRSQQRRDVDRSQPAGTKRRVKGGAEVRDARLPSLEGLQRCRDLCNRVRVGHGLDISTALVSFTTSA